MKTATGTQRSFFGLGYSYMVLGTVAYTLFSLFQSMGLSTMIQQLVLNSGMAAAALTNANTLGGFWVCVAIFFLAPLTKRYGVRTMMSLSFLLLALSTFLWGQCRTPAVYLTLVLIQATGISGILQTGSNVLISNWFPRTKGVAMGVITVGIYVVTFTFVPLISYCSPIYGFEAVMNVLAGALLLLGVACFFWIRDLPEQVGMLPDNRPVEPCEQTPLSQSSSGQWTGRQLLLSRRGIMYVLGFGLATMAIRGIGVSTIPLLLESGFDVATSSLINLGLGALACVGSVIIGIIDTKYGPKRATILFCVICAISLLGSYFTASNAILSTVFFALFFFGNGSLANLVASILMSMYGREHFMRATQFLTPMVNLMVAFSYLGVGQIMSRFDSYNNVRLLFGVFMALSCLFVFFMDDKYTPVPEHRRQADANPIQP